MIREHGVEVRVDYELEEGLARITLKVEDPKLLGKACTFAIDTVFDISEKWFDGSVPECSFDISSLARSQTLERPMEDLGLMPYIGAHLSIRHTWKLHLFDGVLLEGTVWKDNILLPAKPKSVKSPEQLVEPPDSYSFSRNFSAINAERRTLFTIVSVFTLAIVLLISGIGIHDQRVTNEQVIIFPHGKKTHRSKGRWLREPLGKAGAVLVVILSLYIAWMRKTLKSYISFRVKSWPELPRPGQEVKLTDLVSGRPVFTVRNLTLRVVAANYERVSYYDWSQREQIERSAPIRAVLLYEKRIPQLKPRQDIGEVLVNEHFSLTPLFERLLPPKYSGRNGIFVHWEVQLIHDDYIDHEVVGPDRGFAYPDFYRYGTHSLVSEAT